MKNVKVKIFSNASSNVPECAGEPELENEVNAFVKGKEIFDIKFSTSLQEQPDSETGSGIFYSVLVIYSE